MVCKNSSERIRAGVKEFINIVSKLADQKFSKDRLALSVRMGRFIASRASKSDRSSEAGGSARDTENIAAQRGTKVTHIALMKNIRDANFFIAHNMPRDVLKVNRNSSDKIKPNR
jgi:hypothetical protein